MMLIWISIFNFSPRSSNRRLWTEEIIASQPKFYQNISPRSPSRRLWKNETYAPCNKYSENLENNLIPGKDLFLTYETANCPLDIRIVKKLIDNLLSVGL